MEKEKNKIQVLYKPINGNAYIKEIDNDYKAMQELVGGLFEVVEMSGVKGVDLYVNEEGLIYGMPGNFWIPEYQDCVKGPCVMIGYNARTGDSKSITEKQIKECLKYINQYELPDGTDLYRDFHALQEYMTKKYQKNLKKSMEM